jgi:hypothetical protein
MFNRRERNARRIADLQRQISDELRRACRDRTIIVLYTEVNATGVQLDVRRADGATLVPIRAGRDVLEVLVRELWSAFLLDERPRWEAMTLRLGPALPLAIWLTYPEAIERLDGFGGRADRAIRLAAVNLI